MADDEGHHQMIDEPEDPDRPHNLWDPVDDFRDHGSHGVFDDRAKPMSFELELNKRRLPIVAALGVAVLALLGIKRLSSRA